ncbi:MAG: NAD-dependent epimerase/dehydratase family protein [Bryobacteraceae bacterium]
MISSVQELEDQLSRPSPQDVETMRELRGDLLILGVSGKMGPSLARRAVRASEQAGVRKRIIGVARFSEPGAEALLCQSGVETHRADLLDFEQLQTLPDAENVIFMAGRKFGSTGAESLTWAANTYLPAQVAQRYRDSRIVAFSSGNVYPLVAVASGGATEETPPAPLGEYAQSVLGRERMFEYFSSLYGTRVCLLRLNYAIDLRYGVLLDIGTKVFKDEPVDVTMGSVNVIWQGDANSVCLRSFSVCQSPPLALNLTGPETLSVRALAAQFGQLLGKQPAIRGCEAGAALLSNAARCQRLFGYPEFNVDQMIEWTAHWIAHGGARLNKPTHFETRDGKY